MADLVITAANIIKTGVGETEVCTAGVAITPGQAVYKNASNANKLALSDCEDPATAQCDGIALNTAAANQPCVILKKGNLAMGAILTAGESYYVSQIGGGIIPDADLGSGDTVTQVGIATTTSNLKVDIIESGAALA